MIIRFSYDDSFEDLILKLKEKYPKEFLKLNGIDEDNLDITKYSKNYFFKKAPNADKTIDSNANVQSNHIATYQTERFKAHSKLNSIFLLWKTLKKEHGLIEANRLIEEEFNKTINMQDAHNVHLPYCYNFATYDLLTMGLPFIDNLPSTQPKHADTFLQHTIQLCMYAGHQLLGATSIGDVLVVYSYLLKKDSLDENYFTPNYLTDSKKFDNYFEQEMQKFIYTLNQPVRQTQSLFTNITIFDSIFLKEIQKVYFGKDNDDFDINFAMLIQKKFLKCFNKFNKTQLFTFPVLTVQFKKDKNNEIEDEEFFNFICEHNLEFANLNIFSTQNLTALSSCCRLQSQINIDELIQQTKEENTNLIGGSTLKVGSVGVTTINLPRLYFISNHNEELFFEKLKESVLDCIKINHARRTLIQTNIERDKMPLYKYGFINLDSQYSTVGLNGIYEVISLFGDDILSEKGKNLGIKILETIQEIIDEQIKEKKYKINCEQIPAEATGSKLAKADKILFKQDKWPLYSNQFLPLINETDLLNRIELQALYEKYFSGGSILHINIAEKIESVQVMKKLMQYTIKKGVQYFAVNYFFTKCEENHISIFKGDVCPICGKNIVERMTRIVGFLVPLSSWQEERREEFFERKTYRNGELKL